MPIKVDPTAATIPKTAGSAKTVAETVAEAMPAAASIIDPIVETTVMPKTAFELLVLKFKNF